MVSDLPRRPSERMKALTLRASAKVRRHARRGGGQEQGGLVAAGGLADHEAGRRQALGEGEKSFGVVGELGGASGRHVENRDGLLADIAADDAERRDDIRAQRWISSDLLGIVCGRQSGCNDWPLQLIKREGSIGNFV
jgi:hypothetical protein